MKCGARYLSLLLTVSVLLCYQSVAEQFTFEKNDHIAFIGNGLPDRMQHDGWLETYLQIANPDKQLVIRNLGFTGDQIDYRPRNKNFPDEHEYLGMVEADVIFAFFGYNESFAHDPGKFKDDLNKFITDASARRYNGKSAPRIVLFSPIAHEDLGSPNFPDGEENNLWLSIYSDSMIRVARQANVSFVDLYEASETLYEESAEPLTINGIHLNSAGNKAIARVIVEALHGKASEGDIEKTRTAVLDKNWCWFNRYRATDGNDVWGSRATLKFVNDQTNAEVLQHELVMLDIMSANRDRVIWNAIKGETVTPNDANVPSPILVETNYKPSEKTGELSYTSPEEGLETLDLANGMRANLFASEEMFPEFVNPVQLGVDTRGRLWAAVWETYPKWQPDHEMLDRLLILPDENRDGVADEAKTFAFVHNPTGFTFWNGGVIVVSAPNILFLKDTDGDDVADVREVLFSGIDSSDTHHTANGLDYGPDGYIYYQRGIFNVSNVETPWQTAQLSGKSAMYRFNPRTHRFSFHAENPPNPHGGDFDYWGYHYATDGTGGRAFQIRSDGNGLFKMHKLFEKTVRPVASSGIISSTHFPPENNGNFMVLNCIGFLGIKQYTLENTDGVVWGTETDDLLVSSDGNFRPSDFAFGDDGALYVADWSNALVGHMQHNVRDPSRDRNHGRIYRITVEGRPLQESVKIDGQSIEALLDVLKHPTNSVRLRARVELSERDSDTVVAAAQKWILQFDASKKEDAHHLLEALWLHQQHNVLNENLLTVLLNSPEPHARRAAERVKYMWEIEGKLSPDGKAVVEHTVHAQPQRLDLEDDYLAQEKSPEPRMVGDTFEIHIHTLKEQMRYDRTEFIVGIGMKVRLVFFNPDAMDHNMIMVQPGAAQEVAMAALMLGAGGVKKQWKPESTKILFASRMLSIGESQTIEFTAPEEPGFYDYICTFPGHWQLMRGVMIVEAEPGEHMRLTAAGEEAADGGFWDTFSGGAGAEAPAEPEEVVTIAEAQQARAAENVTLAKGFKAELLYVAPHSLQGSWVSLCKDDKGRLIVSDGRDKGLFLITPAKLGDPDSLTEAVKIDVPVSGAQGLCWANGALYANVSDGEAGGLWRIRDTDGDGALDQAEHLIALRGSGEHGPHGVIPAEDGKGLYFMGGNNTRTPPYDSSRAPDSWGDDLVLTRHWDDLGNVRGPIPADVAPGGWVAYCDFDGKNIELIGNGFRNAYDLALNGAGEMFTFDADTEWDLGMPWYRPARIYHVVSGGDFGWRPGTGKWPAHFEDSVAPLLDIGPASPAGMVFGTGAKFPGRYQKALYALDWRFGAIYAVHLQPDGASYTATHEVFISGKPLAVTDAVVGDDGALYFTVGGRGTQSALYRVIYTGADTAAALTDHSDSGAAARHQRRALEALHRSAGTEAINAAWSHLGSADRAMRYAARVAIEKQPVQTWRQRALDERDPRTAVTALMALARQGDAADLEALLGALGRVHYGGDAALGLSALRTCELAFVRMGKPKGALRNTVLEALDTVYPAQDADINAALAELLISLQSPTVLTKTVPMMISVGVAELPDWAEHIKRSELRYLYGGSVRRLLSKSPHIESLHLAFILRNVTEGWTLKQRQAYFEFFKDAAKRSGGPRYGEYLTAIRAEAISACTQTERKQLATFMDAPLLPKPPKSVTPPQGPGRMWTKAAAIEVIGSEPAGRSYARGQNLFHAAACSLCHQFDGMGGVGGAIGPELSSVVNKYSVADLLDSIITPSKDIPDQYGAVIATTKSGKTVMGRPVEGAGTVQVFSQDPDGPVELLNPGDLASLRLSPVSQMPPALINMLNEEELKDLVAFLLSSGDRNAPVFKN